MQRYEKLLEEERIKNEQFLQKKRLNITNKNSISSNDKNSVQTTKEINFSNSFKQITKLKNELQGETKKNILNVSNSLCNSQEKDDFTNSSFCVNKNITNQKINNSNNYFSLYFDIEQERKKLEEMILDIQEKKNNNKNYLEDIYNYSKLNYIIFTLDNEKNQELFNSDKYAPNVYDHIEITRNDLNYDKNESNILIFDEFIDELKKKYDLFKIFQKYSIEKSIISFKDYLYNFNKYDKIEDEYTLIDYFNRFEKLSYNNDYADVTIILLQIMITKKNILTSNFTFNVKALKCGFCTAELYESEFIDENKCFYCPFCIHLKNKLQKENK